MKPTSIEHNGYLRNHENYNLSWQTLNSTVDYHDRVQLAAEQLVISASSILIVIELECTGT